MQRHGPSPSDAALLGRLRRAGWRHRVGFGRLLCVGVVVGIFLVGNASVADNQVIADSGPSRVVAVTRLEDERAGLSVYVRVDGHERELVDGDSLPNDPYVGDRVRVAIDPADPSYVVAVDGRQGWEYTGLGGALFGLLGVGVIFFIAHRGREPRGVIRALRRPTLRRGEVVRCGTDGEGVSHVDVQLGDDVLRWAGSTWSVRAPDRSAVRLVGDIRVAGWAVLVTEEDNDLWPDRPLSQASLVGALPDGATSGVQPEARSEYEVWLDGIAGRRVSTGSLFLVWVALVAAACTVAYFFGTGEEITYSGATGIVSVPYWFIAVPLWLKRGRRT